MSKYFTENFVHGDEAILSEKWPFWSLGEALPDEKSGRKRRRFAHLIYFCARFLLKFCPFSRFCKHAKFSKVNAKFFCGVDFFFSTNAFFCQNYHNCLIISNLAKHLKTRVFSSKSFFAQNFQNMEAKNGHFVKIVQNRKTPHRDIGEAFCYTLLAVADINSQGSAMQPSEHRSSRCRPRSSDRR